MYHLIFSRWSGQKTCDGLWWRVNLSRRLQLIQSSPATNIIHVMISPVCCGGNHWVCFPPALLVDTCSYCSVLQKTRSSRVTSCVCGALSLVALHPVCVQPARFDYSSVLCVCGYFYFGSCSLSLFDTTAWCFWSSWSWLKYRRVNPPVREEPRRRPEGNTEPWMSPSHVQNESSFHMWPDPESLSEDFFSKMIFKIETCFLWHVESRFLWKAWVNVTLTRFLVGTRLCSETVVSDGAVRYRLGGFLCVSDL